MQECVFTWMFWIRLSLRNPAVTFIASEDLYIWTISRHVSDSLLGDGDGGCGRVVYCTDG